MQLHEIVNDIVSLWICITPIYPTPWDVWKLILTKKLHFSDFVWYNVEKRRETKPIPCLRLIGHLILFGILTPWAATLIYCNAVLLPNAQASKCQFERHSARVSIKVDLWVQPFIPRTTNPIRSKNVCWILRKWGGFGVVFEGYFKANIVKRANLTWNFLARWWY